MKLSGHAALSKKRVGKFAASCDPCLGCNQPITPVNMFSIAGDEANRLSALQKLTSDKALICTLLSVESLTEQVCFELQNLIIPKVTKASGKKGKSAVSAKSGGHTRDIKQSEDEKKGLVMSEQSSTAEKEETHVESSSIASESEGTTSTKAASALFEAAQLPRGISDDVLPTTLIEKAGGKTSDMQALFVGTPLKLTSRTVSQKTPAQ